MSNNSPISPNQIGDYTLQNEIGKGGFATVHKGIHIPTGEKVAIKIIDKTQLQEDPLNLCSAMKTAMMKLENPTVR